MVYAVEVFRDVQFQAIPFRARLSVHLAHPVLQAFGCPVATLALAASIGILNEQLIEHRIQILVQAPLHDTVRVIESHHQPPLGHINPQLPIRPQLILAGHHASLYGKEVIFQMRGEGHDFRPVSLAFPGIPVCLKQLLKLAYFAPCVFNNLHKFSMAARDVSAFAAIHIFSRKPGREPGPF